MGLQPCVRGGVAAVSKVRAALVFAVCLLAFALTSPWAVSAPPDVTEATSALSRIPGLKLLQGLSVTDAGNGAFAIALKKPDGTPATALTAYAFKGTAGWNASIVLNDPKSFAMPGVDQLNLGLNGFVVVASEATDSIKLSDLPSVVGTSVTPFAGTDGGVQKLALKQGINVFVAASVTASGTLDTLRNALGMSSGDVTLTGTVGPAVFLKVLGSAGASVGSDADDSVSLTVTLPSASPTASLSADERKQFDIQIASPSVTVSKAKGATTWTVTGSMSATVTAFEKTQTVNATLSLATNRTITISGSLALAQPFKPFGVDTVQVTALGLDAVIVPAAGTTPGTKDIAISAGLNLGSKSVTARFSASMAGSKVKSIAAGISGSLAVPSALLQNGESVTITDPTIGLMMESKDGFVSGQVTWRNISATAVLYGRRSPAGMALFVKLKEGDANAKLSTITGASLSSGMDIHVPKTVVVLSSVAMDDLPLDKLPDAASAMLTSIGKKTGDKVTAGVGLTFYTALKLHDFVSDFPDGDPLVIGGSVTLENKKPKFKISAQFPDFKMPDQVTKYGLKSVQPAMFLALTPGVPVPTLEIGVELDLGLNDGSQDITLSGKIAAVIGAGPPAIKTSGILKTDWDHPFGLDGIKLLAPMGVVFSLASDGSVAIVMDGGAQFNSHKDVKNNPCTSASHPAEQDWCTTIKLGGGVSILFSSGIPTVKGIAMRASASQLELLTPVKIGQTILHAAASVADKLVTKVEGTVRKPLPSEIKTVLNAMKGVDAVSAIDALIPSTGPAKDLATVKIKDAEIFLATPGMETTDFPDLDDVGIRVKGTLLVKGAQIVKVDNYLTTKKGFQILVQPGESIANFSIGPLAITTPSIDVGFPLPPTLDDLGHFKFSGGAAIKGVNLVNVDVNLSKSLIHVRAAAGFNSCAPLSTNKLRPGAEVFLQGTGGYLVRMNSSNAIDGTGPFNSMADVPASYMWERWRVVEASNDEIALYNPSQRKYLRAHDNVVDTGAKTSGLWERFKVVARGDSVALFNAHTNRWVSFNGRSAVVSQDGAATNKAINFKAYELSWRADPLTASARAIATASASTKTILTNAFNTVYATNTPANDTACGTWGANAAIAGDIKGVTNFNLTGNGRFDPPSVLSSVGFPSAGASFTIDSSTGASFSASVHWDAAKFDISGRFHTFQNWDLTCKAHVDGTPAGHPAVFYLGNTKVASLTVGPTDLSLSISSSGGAKLHASGSGSIDVVKAKTIAWNFSGDLALDHKIKTTIPIPDAYNHTYGSCPSGYRTDPLTCWRDADSINRSLGGCASGYDTLPLTCFRGADSYGNGCSGNCSSGYHNTGCTCLRYADSYNRTMGPCPSDYDTLPATCFRGAKSIARPTDACKSGYKDDGLGSCIGTKDYAIEFNIFP